MIVVGAGRVGRGLQRRAASHGQPITLVDRTSGWDGVSQGIAPILVAVRNDDLVDVIARTPVPRRRDLVFVQNGAVRELLAEAGVLDATRGLLYVMVVSREAALVPGLTNWFSGPRAGEVAAWFRGLDLDARAIDAPPFAEQELEKLLWLAVHGPLCEAHGATVGQVAAAHRAELDAWVAELLPVGEAAWGVRVPPRQMADRLVAYSATIPDYRVSVKEWPYRNGWFVRQAAAHRLSIPRHDTLLRSLGHLVRPGPSPG